MVQSTRSPSRYDEAARRGREIMLHVSNPWSEELGIHVKWGLLDKVDEVVAGDEPEQFHLPNDNAAC